MANQFTKIAFTDSVKSIQSLMGSRRNYARFEEAGANSNELLTENEADFLSTRDSFYIATMSENGWPYVQHRGGPKGFIKVMSSQEIAIPDFSGNRQYISVGNLSVKNKVALIFVDYPSQSRLKVLGEARVVDSESDAALIAKLQPQNYKARIERAFVIKIHGYDWNCPQHIKPRWTAEEIEQAVEPLKQRIAELEAQVDKLKNQ